MTWAFEQDLTPDLKIVLLALADYADPDGVCFPGQKAIAKKCSMAERTVREKVAKLVEMGYIERRQRRGEGGYRTTDEYRLLPARPAGRPENLPANQGVPHRQTVAGTEEPSEPSVTTTARARQMPPEFTWSNAHSLKATAKGVDVEVELEKFRDYHLARGSKFVDWDRALHTWLNNARPDPGGGQRTVTRPARITPTDRMNAVLAIEDPREQRALDG